jgi:hypothetical protein
MLVEVVGTPFTTQTAETGEFLLSVSAGVHTVRVSAPGYASVEVAGVEVVGGGAVQLGEDIVLTGEPGRISGSVSLEHGFADSGALARVDVVLWGPDETQLGQVRPDAEGAYFFESVPAGTYRIEAALAGFVTRSTHGGQAESTPTFP